VHPISHRFPDALSGSQIIAFDKGVPLANALVLVNLCEYRHKSYTAEYCGRFFGLHFSADNMGLSLTTLTKLAPKAN